MLLSSLRAQLLASEAEVARLRAENARLRHESLQRAFVHVANGNNDVPVPAGTAAASATRLRASSIAGVSALCSLKRPSSSDRIAGADVGSDNGAAAAPAAAAAAPAPAPAPAPGQHGGSLCLIPGCSEPSEGERSSHLCRIHHGQLRSAAANGANSSPRRESEDKKPPGKSSGSPEAKKQKKKKVVPQKAAAVPTPARSSKKRHDGDKPTAKVDDATVETGAAAAASSNTSAADLAAGGSLDLEAEKLTRSQRRLLESMMRQDSNTSARATRNGVSSSQEMTKARKMASAKPKRDTTEAGNDSPTRLTKRRITKPNRPGFGETKEGRGSDYARIFIRQTLLETLRKVGTAVDPYGFFSSPVDPVADDCPDYYDVVDRETEAMDLGSIESMIKDGTISTVDEMRTMLMRIAHSCRKYNRDEDDEVRQEGEKILPLSEPFLDRARRAIEQQMKKSGCVETGEGAVHDTISSSVSSPRAEKRQRIEGGTNKQQGKQGRGARTNDSSKTASGPIQVFDRPAPDIGSGWRIIGIQRCRGKYPEHVDKYWLSPKAKKRLRSRKEVSRFLAALDKTEGSEEEAFRMIQR